LQNDGAKVGILSKHLSLAQLGCASCSFPFAAFMDSWFYVYEQGITALLKSSILKSGKRGIPSFAPSLSLVPGSFKIFYFKRGENRFSCSHYPFSYPFRGIQR